MKTREIGIGIIGAGYMGKAHAVAYAAVGAVFNTSLRPVLEMISTSTEDGARKRAAEFGFRRGTGDWRVLVNDPKVEAVIIASPQSTHKDIALAALQCGKPVFCEKPLGQSLAEARAMARAAHEAGVVTMTGFNYIRTPASQLAREMIKAGEIGDITYFRGEHTEDFLADPALPATWRTQGRAEGTMGDLAPHILNAAFALAGPISSLIADIETVHHTRMTPHGPAPVTNDDQAHMLCRFENGAMGSLFISRIATGRKMGYAYDIYGTKGALRFDGEDQNALWFYRMDQPSHRQGFTKILTGPEHPDFKSFCLGPGHGTGYQDQIIIEARDFLNAVESGQTLWPSFEDGVRVSEAVDAAFRSHEARRWVSLSEL